MYRRGMVKQGFLAVVAVTGLVMWSGGHAAHGAGIVTNNFDQDPGWEEFGSREPPQNFGFSDTNFAGGDPGEIGGTIVRATEAYYADDIFALDPSTETLTVTGIGVLQNPSSGNVLVGWFDKDSDFNWPPAHFLGFRSDENDLYLYASGGGDPLAQDLEPGVPFSFEVTYDPDANDGNGAISGSIDGGDVVTRNLGGGDKDALNTFNRFGLLGLFISGSGNTTEAYFDNLSYTTGAPTDGKLCDFDNDDDCDTSDFDILRANFLTKTSLGDMDGDLDVDLVDFRRFKDAFRREQAGGARPAAENVPEPHTAYLLTTGILVWLARRRVAW